MNVYDGRKVAEGLTLDGQGFAFTRHESRVVNFYDPDEVQRVYYPEVAQLIKDATGATRVHVFDHNVRCRPMAKEGLNGAREPVKFTHNDYTLKSGPQRVRELMGDEAEELLKHRFAEINVWRPIRGPVGESPLAVCDAQSMTLSDFIATDLKYRDRTGEVYSLAYSPNHRWYYFPKMQRDEVVLLKCFDSGTTAARALPHTPDSTIPPAPPTPPRARASKRGCCYSSGNKRRQAVQVRELKRPVGIAHRPFISPIGCGSCGVKKGLDDLKGRNF
jgi:hypothetical protein